jgi:hypothetical protein
MVVGSAVRSALPFGATRSAVIRHLSRAFPLQSPAASSLDPDGSTWARLTEERQNGAVRHAGPTARRVRMRVAIPGVGRRAPVGRGSLLGRRAVEVG